MALALPNSQLVDLSGPDAARFAHAQFANDVLALKPGHWQWNAWLSPQGRVRWFFALLRPAPDRLLLWPRGGAASTLREELARFVFRAKVRPDVPEQLRATGAEEAEIFTAFGSCPDGDALASHADALALRLPFGARWLLLADRAPAQAADATALLQWQLDDIHAGLPLLAPALQDQLLPQWLGLDRLHAFSTSKGCYPGQEVMARLHFKGGNKRWLYHVGFACDALPPPGTRIGSETGDAATLVDAVLTRPHRAEGLAVLSDAAAAGRLGDSATAALSDIQVISRFS